MRLGCFQDSGYFPSVCLAVRGQLESFQRNVPAQHPVSCYRAHVLDVNDLCGLFKAVGRGSMHLLGDSARIHST